MRQAGGSQNERESGEEAHVPSGPFPGIPKPLQGP